MAIPGVVVLLDPPPQEHKLGGGNAGAALCVVGRGMIESTTMSTREPLMMPFGETLQLQRAIRASDGSQRHGGKNACEGRPQGASGERGSGAAAGAQPSSGLLQ